MREQTTATILLVLLGLATAATFYGLTGNGLAAIAAAILPLSAIPTVYANAQNRRLQDQLVEEQAAHRETAGRLRVAEYRIARAQQEETPGFLESATPRELEPTPAHIRARNNAAQPFPEEGRGNVTSQTKTAQRQEMILDTLDKLGDASAREIYESSPEAEKPGITVYHTALRELQEEGKVDVLRRERRNSPRRAKIYALKETG